MEKSLPKCLPFLLLLLLSSSTSIETNKDQNFSNPMSVVTVPAANPTNPTTTPVPITVPGASNPVTNYPSPPPPANGAIGIPPPPAATTTNSSTAGTQSWCVAKSGASESTLQTALDYACGKGADCSQIQKGGSCSNPSSLQNYASVAFNSYYQKNHAATSCDFGGVATIVTTNPSSGSCIFPSSAASGGGGGLSSGVNSSSPGSSGLNSSSPGSTSTFPGFGTSPSSYNPSSGWRPLISCIGLVIGVVVVYV